MRRSADDAQQLAERRGCRIEFRLPVQACMAEVDRRRVERILRNLLVNAVEHGEGRDVVVTVAEDRDAVAVAVRDHGVGLAPGEEQLVFERFWRADPARARTTGGTGLGLAIALEDAHLHGGWLQAWGEKGRGSVFRLTLPRTAGQPLAGSPLPLGPDEADVITSAVTTLEADLAALAGPTTPVTREAWPTRRTSDGSAGRARPAGGCGHGRAGGACGAHRHGAVHGGLRVDADRRARCSPTRSPRGRTRRATLTCRSSRSNRDAGWSPKQIVQGFLTASASFGTYGQVALQYLTPQEQKVWSHPPWSAVVYKNGPNVADPIYPAGRKARRARTMRRT